MDFPAAKPIPFITWDTLIPPITDYEYFQFSSMLPFVWQADNLSLINACWLSEAALLAYAGESFARPRFSAAGFDRIHFFNGPGTRCYLVACEDFAILTFRGTESDLRQGLGGLPQFIADLKTDLNCRLVGHEKCGRIHKGFDMALDEVWPGLKEQLDLLAGRPLWITGHSLGGALAILAAARFKEVRGVYTFGSPRVGDMAFARGFPIPAFRFVHQNDFVTKMPPFPFVHVGRLHRLDHQGRLAYREVPRPPLIDTLRVKLMLIAQTIRDLRTTSAVFLPESLKDHAPLLYVLHIWNNLAAGGGIR